MNLRWCILLVHIAMQLCNKFSYKACYFPALLLVFFIVSYCWIVQNLLKIHSYSSWHDILGEKSQKTGNTGIAQIFCWLLLYLHGLRIKETTQLIGYTAIFTKGCMWTSSLILQPEKLWKYRMILLWVPLEHMFQGSNMCTISRNCGPCLVISNLSI